MTTLKTWHIYEGDKKKIEKLAKEANLNPRFAALLVERGIETKEAAKTFLNPDECQPFHDPFLMKDMDLGVKRVIKAIENREKITVFGDYDVDGITATSLLTNTLKKLDADVDFYIPSRQNEGYGLNVDALEELYKSGTKLVITVDCGIAGINEVNAVKDFLDIVITDHHIPLETLPDAVAIINPHRTDCEYPDKNLSGVGVAFKLCQALYKKIKNEDFTDDLDFVALGTIADIVPLIGENRKFVKLGLKAIQETNKPGVDALVTVSALSGKEINTGHVGFGLAPRLNAAGRIGHAKDGVMLLLSNDKAEAERIAEDLNDCNLERQNIEKDILKEAIEKINAMDLSKIHSIVLDGENWHSGVIGIVASRLVEIYYLPTIIISHQGDVGKGSCRSIPALHMHEALSANSKYLLGFGGHSQAAGLTIKLSEIENFRESFDEYVAKTLKPEDYEQMVEISAIINPDDLDEDFVGKLGLLEPYGMGNPKPTFGAKNVMGRSPRVVGKDREHLSFLLGERKNCSAVSWNKANYLDLMSRERLDICYQAQLSEWQGVKKIEMIVGSIEPAEVERVHPNRDLLARIFLLLKKLQSTGSVPNNPFSLTAHFARNCNLHCSLFTMKEALKIFEEIGLLTIEDEKHYKLNIPKEKLNLMMSPTYSAHNAE